MLLNGPESFTLDGNFILGEAPELARLLRVRRLQLGRHRERRRRGQARRASGSSTARRRSTCGTSTSAASRRSTPIAGISPTAPSRSLGLHYAMRWPREELATRASAAPLAALRPARREAARCSAASSTGSARTTSCRPARASRAYTLGTPGWLPYVLEEQRACREDVVVFDQTSFAKFVLKGRDALAVLQRLCANEIDVPPGRMVYTAMLNARGGFESDLTIAAPRRATSSSSSPARRRRRATSRGSSGTSRADEHAALVDVTERVFGALGDGAEGARRCSRACRPTICRKAALPFSTTREIDVGYARVRAARMSYVGGPGYELYVPADQCVTLYDALCEPRRGRSACATPATTRSTRCASRPAAAPGAPSCRPTRRRWKPGLGYAVKLDKPAPFIGRDALLRAARRRAAQAARACSRSTIPPRSPGAASRS